MANCDPGLGDLKTMKSNANKIDGSQTHFSIIKTHIPFSKVKGSILSLRLQVFDVSGHTATNNLIAFL